MGWVATFTNPEEVYAGTGASAAITCRECNIQAQIGEADQCVLLIDFDVLTSYEDETDSSNPCQLFSLVTVTRDGDTYFRGRVSERPLMREESNELEVHIEGYDAVLERTLVPSATGAYDWSMETSAVGVTNITILPVDTSGEYSDDWYPAPAHATLWYEPTGVTDTLDVGIDAVQTDIVLASVGFQGFPQDSFVLIDSEWIYYEGYQDATGGKYQLTNCVRGALGTAAAAHLAGATVTPKVAKQMAPNEPVIVYHWNGVSWDDFTGFEIDPLDGKFFMPYSVDAFKADYSVYDHDGSLGGGVVVDIADVILRAVKAPMAYGGAGYEDTDHDIVDLGIAITRVDYSPKGLTPFAAEFIRTVLNIEGLENELLFYFNHTDGKFKLLDMSQSVSPDIYLPHVSSMVKERNIFDLYSGILVAYSKEVARNVATALHAWRASNGQSTGVGGGVGAPAWWGWNAVGGKTITDDNYVSQYAVTDLSTYAGPTWDGILIPSYPHYLGYFYFGADAPVMSVDELSFTIGVWGKGAWDLTWEGADDWDSSNPNTSGAFVKLSPELSRLIGSAGGSVTSGQKKSYTGKQFTKKLLNCVRLRVDSFPTDNDVDMDRLYMHELKIVANSQSYEFVQLTDAPTTNQLLVRADLSYRKIRGNIKASIGVGGSPRADFWDVGGASRGAAISAARLHLKTALQLYAAHSYLSYTPPVDASGSTVKPELGMTVEVTESFGVTYTGILRGYQIKNVGGELEYTFDVLDYDADPVE